MRVEKVRRRHLPASLSHEHMFFASDMELRKAASTLGYDLELRRVSGEGSLLAWAAQPLIREALEKCLAERLGLGPALAGHVIQVKLLDQELLITCSAVE